MKAFFFDMTILCIVNMSYEESHTLPQLLHEVSIKDKDSTEDKKSEDDTDIIGTCLTDLKQGKKANVIVEI